MTRPTRLEVTLGTQLLELAASLDDLMDTIAEAEIMDIALMTEEQVRLLLETGASVTPESVVLAFPRPPVVPDEIVFRPRKSMAARGHAKTLGSGRRRLPLGLFVFIGSSLEREATIVVEERNGRLFVRHDAGPRLKVRATGMKIGSTYVELPVSEVSDDTTVEIVLKQHLTWSE
jgi:hypothetical protein